MPFDVYSMGFSNRSWEETLEILSAFQIARLVDIRTVPGSRHTPQFNRAHMEEALPRSNVDYVHLKGLGGFRKPARSSTANSAWKNPGFRGYADYMQTESFSTSLQQLVSLLAQKVTVYCCTEAVFWRCHRQLVSDALTVQGYRVGHIFGTGKVELHKLSAALRLDAGKLTYPGLPLEEM